MLAISYNRRTFAEREKRDIIIREINFFYGWKFGIGKIYYGVVYPDKK